MRRSPINREVIEVMRFDIRRITPEFLAASLSGLLFAYLLARGGALHADVLKGAAEDKGTEGGLKGLVGTINQLTDMALYAAFAAMPLAVIGGGVALAFGSRRGMPIVITAFGVLVLLGAAKGIVE